MPLSCRQNLCVGQLITGKLWYDIEGEFDPTNIADGWRILWHITSSMKFILGMLSADFYWGLDFQTAI